MLILAFLTFFGWKIIKRTKFVKPYEADMVWERPTIDAYEATFMDPPVGFWREMIGLVGIGRKKEGGNRRRSSVIDA
jgi:yeast amino acid transporter